MRELPILFSGAMVRALLDGSKTQTRRVVKLPHQNPLGEWQATTVGGEFGGRLSTGETIPLQGAIWHMRTGDCLMSPHGSPGDRLYVRETWSADFANNYPFEPVWYAADNDRRYEIDTVDGVRGIHSPESHAHIPFRWRPSIHMPRAMSRITLEVTGVRVEKLQTMEGQTAFESDALKEGIHRIHHGDGEYSYHAHRKDPHPNNWTDPCDAFHDLWDSLNAARGYSWVSNPWVWVVEFKRIKP